ncbi:MAG: formylglycine-generating enzyme family protein [Spirochaetales bacterium]|nr:formylglycine-generating enzyme family protein [Spirochaetales bacterium]
MKRRIVLPEVEEVKLPVLFSMRPGMYLLILYTLFIVAAIFCIAFLPGILKGGRYVTFTAPLSESGIVLDGTYLGSADNQYFITSGSHEITYMKGGVAYASSTMEVDHPVFLTWLFHRTKTAETPAMGMSEEQKREVIRYNLEQVQAASAILSYDAVTRFEKVYTNLLTDLTAMDVPDETLTEALELSLLYCTNETMLADALDALQRFQVSQSSFLKELITLANNIVENNAGKAGLPGESISLQKEVRKLKAGDLELTGYRYPQARFVMGRTVDLAYPAVNEAGVAVTTPTFVLSSEEVSQYQWALFLQENPMWEKSNLAALQAQGLVDEAYLAGLSPSTVFVTNRPIHNISYYAAQAFCDWLSKKTGKSVFIPSESMWTVAALSHSNLAFAASLSPIPTQLEEPVSLLGGVWELTSTTHIPLARITDYQKAHALHQRFGLPVQPIVKGGSYLNDAKSISSNTVGVVDPDACGDFIGFRVAWYE